MLFGCETKRVEFYELCSDNGLIQIVEEQTSLNNIINLVLCNDRTLLAKVEVSSPFRTSDRLVFQLFLQRAGTREIALYFTVLQFLLNWQETYYKSFLEYCKSIDRSEKLKKESSVDELRCALLQPSRRE